jgi:prevent-host-death family protein
MIKRMSAREARARFAELTDEVRYTGEPVIIEKQGRPFVAVIRADDLEDWDRLRRQRSFAKFTRLAREAALKDPLPELTEEEIVQAVKATREEIFRERYGSS